MSEDIAIWRRALTSENGEQMREDVMEERLEASEYQGRINKSQTLGNMIIDSFHLILRTKDERAKDIHQDDSIEWYGMRYSVIEVQSVRSCEYLGAREYLICLN